jgi:hypothetical protein
MSNNLLLSNNVEPIIYEIQTLFRPQFAKTIIIYNSLVDIPLHKIWIHINRCKICNVNGLELKIALSNQDKKNVELIENLENKILEKLRVDISDNLYFKTELDLKDSFAPTLGITFDMDTVFFKYDGNESDQKTTIIKGRDVSIILELCHLNFSRNTLVPQWKALQIKQHEPINFSKFITDITQVQTPIYTNITIPNIPSVPTIPKVPSIPSIPLSHTQINLSNKPIPNNTSNQNSTDYQPRLVITQDELLNVLGKLKKCNNNAMTINTNEINNSNKIILNKVITKEPMTIKEIYDNNIINDTNEINEYMININKMKKYLNYNNEDIKYKSRNISNFCTTLDIIIK